MTRVAKVIDQASYALFWMQHYSNKNSNFISLSKVQHGVVRSVIVFPAGREGKGWTGVAKVLNQVLFAPKNNQVVQTAKQKWLHNQKTVQKKQQTKQGRTYAATVALADQTQGGRTG